MWCPNVIPPPTERRRSRVTQALRAGRARAWRFPVQRRSLPFQRVRVPQVEVPRCHHSHIQQRGSRVTDPLKAWT